MRECKKKLDHHKKQFGHWSETKPAVFKPCQKRHALSFIELKSLLQREILRELPE